MPELTTISPSRSTMANCWLAFARCWLSSARDVLVSIRARSLGEILAGRIAFFAVLAMLAQVAIVFANYYWNDGELSRLLIERETEQLAGGISGPSEQPFFALPD